MIRQRVVITGMGTVNPLGTTIEEFWRRSVAGTSGVGTVTAFPIPDHMSQIAGMIGDLPAGQVSAVLEEGERAGDLDRSLLFALIATRSALADAGIAEDDLRDRRQAGVSIATAIAQISKMEQAFYEQSRGGSVPVAPREAHTTARNSFHFNTTAAEIARRLGTRGGAVTVATGCTGGVDALGHAFQAIRRGRLDVVIAGATEAPITPLVVAAFSRIQAVSLRNAEPQRASRPFDKDRDGFVLGEGCAVLTLESLEHALERGASIYAEIKGFSSVNNCYHMTDIPQDGHSIADSCSAALDDAAMGPSEIDCINAHGSSTPQNDVAEASAFHRVFGRRAANIPVTSLKSQTGHSLSAANSIEICSAVLTLQQRIILPTINVDELDERCQLDVVANTARRAPVSCILKVSSGFSGIHSSLVIAAYGEAGARGAAPWAQTPAA